MLAGVLLAGIAAAYGNSYWGDSSVPAALFGGAVTLAALVLPAAGLVNQFLTASVDHGVRSVATAARQSAERVRLAKLWTDNFHADERRLDLALLGFLLTLIGFVLASVALIHPRFTVWHPKPRWRRVTAEDDAVGFGFSTLLGALCCYLPLTHRLLGRKTISDGLTAIERIKNLVPSVQTDDQATADLQTPTQPASSASDAAIPGLVESDPNGG